MAFAWESVVTAKDDGRLLRDVLRGTLGISQRLLHALKFQGTISVNETQVTVRARVRTGDRIALFLPEATDEQRVVPQDLPLSLVYEDADLLVLNKPVGMIVHPVPPEPYGTLANAIAWYWQQQGLSAPVRVVTRLDRDTSGLVLVAKNALAQHFYSSAPGAITKRYLALIQGHPGAAGGVIDAPIGVNPENPATRRVDAGGKPAQTAWSLLETHCTYSLIQVELLTGRTHQIRVHFAHTGHPLLGDEQYGGDCRLISRQALHCHRLQLRHVRSDADLLLEAPVPEDMKKLCASSAREPVQR